MSSRQDITNSLNALPPDTAHRRFQPEAPRPKRRRWVKRVIAWVIIIIILAALSIVVYLGGQAVAVSSRVFNGGSVLNLLLPGTPLKTDSQGRTNILLFGTSQDDPAHQNAQGGGGLWLTDSIMLLSVNQATHAIRIVSIPRDLWVSTDGCTVGAYAKINALYECGAGLTDTSAGQTYTKPQDAAGARALMRGVVNATGVTPQYYVHTGYTALRRAVNAVGGIDVAITGDGADGIYDTNFDWNCPSGPYTCKNVYYPHNGTYHLNGTQALYLARARADTGLYSYKDFGLARGDFDRQVNQQKILLALETNLKQPGVFMNPFVLNNLIAAFGQNISTDLSGGEVKSLLSAMMRPGGVIKPISLIKDGSPAVMPATIDGQSVIIPTSGVYDYSSIINYLGQQL